MSLLKSTHHIKERGMKYLVIMFVLFLSGCGDVSITTTSSGGNSADPEVVQPVIVEVSR